MNDTDKIPLLQGCEDADLLRMRDLLISTLEAVETEIFKRQIPAQQVKHNNKVLSIQYVIEDNEFEINFK
jgi:hypothetical protein